MKKYGKDEDLIQWCGAASIASPWELEWNSPDGVYFFFPSKLTLDRYYRS